MRFEIFLMICNYVGTAAFAASGVLKGIKYKLDMFGITLLAVITALGGGILRDILVARIPDVLINPEGLYIAIITSGTMWLFTKKIRKKIKISRRRKMRLYKLITTSNLIFDSIGLAAFTLIAADKSISLELNTVTTGILAAVTGVGGGIIRDLLVTETPIVLREDIYAVLAFGGGILYHVSIVQFSFLKVPTMATLFTIILIIRLVIIKYKVNLPNIN